jgi:two-component system LytT family sensor kinase
LRHQLEARLTEARLRTLQTQLHPHFLFNALNTISAYTESEPRLARQMMARLAELLRASLDHAGQREVPLKDELTFLDNYLAIERLRFEDRLTVDIAVDEHARSALVPAFLLQPLVENAIRHGINAQMRGGHILIAARRRHPQLLALTIEDDGAGLPAGWCVEDHGGIGLRNTVQRLAELYGTNHDFRITGEPGNGVRVDIVLPYHAAGGNEYRPPQVPEVAAL